MNIDTPAGQAISLIMFQIINPLIIGVPLGFFLKFLTGPFRYFTSHFKGRSFKRLG